MGKLNATRAKGAIGALDSRFAGRSGRRGSGAAEWLA